jgi:hypothetical protein
MASNDFTHRKGRRSPAILLGCLAIIALLALPSLAVAQGSDTAGSSGSFDVGGQSAPDQPGGTGSNDLDTGTPTGDQYSDTPHRILHFTSASSAPAGGLPFTGFDVGIVALIGAVLLGTGVLVRRLGRGSTDA